MRANPFHWPPPENADVGFAQGLLLVDGSLVCEKYAREGLAILRGQPWWEYMDDLKNLHDGHYQFGMEAMGCIGRSRDVSRTALLSQGEHSMTSA